MGRKIKGSVGTPHPVIFTSKVAPPLIHKLTKQAVLNFKGSLVDYLLDLFLCDANYHIERKHQLLSLLPEKMCMMLLKFGGDCY